MATCSFYNHGFADINGLDINKKIWVSIAYILYGVSYTGTSMPFGAMASVITKNQMKEQNCLQQEL